MVTTGAQGDSSLHGNISAGLNQVFRGSPVPQLSVKTMGINYTIQGTNSEGTMIQYEGVVQGNELPVSHLANDSGAGLMVIVNRDAFLLDVEVVPQYSFFAAVAQLIAWALAVLSVGRSAVLALSKVCERKIYYSVLDSQRIRATGDKGKGEVQMETYGSQRELNNSSTNPTQSQRNSSNDNDVPRASGAVTTNGTNGTHTSPAPSSITPAPASTTTTQQEQGEGEQPVEVEVFREAGSGTNDTDQEVRARQSEESKEFN
jgi:hypothetical protein